MKINNKKRKNCIKGILFAWLLLSIIVVLFSVFFFDGHSLKINVNKSINAGLFFLKKSQLANGEIESLYCENSKMENCKFESATVPTILALDALSYSQKQDSIDIIEKGARFVLSQQGENGIWSYWAMGSKFFVNPDFDDTAVASRFFEENKIKFKQNKEKFEKNPNGLYYTWLSGDELIKKTEIDPAVNANILAYLKSDDKKVCDFINDVVKNERRRLFYYPDKQAFYYIISKAYANGVTCLSESRDDMINKTIAFKKEDGSFGSNLQTAFSLATLLNYSFEKRDIVESGVRSLLKAQRKDGSWQIQTFYVTGIIDPILYFGSDELSTSISIEVLERFLRSY